MAEYVNASLEYVNASNASSTYSAPACPTYCLDSEFGLDEPPLPTKVESAQKLVRDTMGLAEYPCDSYTYEDTLTGLTYNETICQVCEELLFVAPCGSS